MAAKKLVGNPDMDILPFGVQVIVICRAGLFPSLLFGMVFFSFVSWVNTR